MQIPENMSRCRQVIVGRATHRNDAVQPPTAPAPLRVGAGGGIPQELCQQS